MPWCKTYATVKMVTFFVIFKSNSWTLASMLTPLSFKLFAKTYVIIRTTSNLLVCKIRSMFH